MSLAAIILLLVTLQRLGELVLARRNTERLKARGAIEIGARHYPLIVSVHAAWLIALWILGLDQSVNLVLLAVFVMLQGLRLWVLATLRSRWTTRIIVLPGESLVNSGPYRYISHPNYAIVTAEIAVLPLALHLPVVALLFTILNAMVLSIRLRAEGRALVAVSASAVTAGNGVPARATS
ncbi:isoprenylcysteine carboxyl methyltransferase family protein [Bradyrhizobium sp.]|uniref:isoprenylcysteine carboxyl methyltransferase family protein n=1 Tax=Bradyrhizobium sp. TaxID=376 RepID=UPI003C3501F6